MALETGTRVRIGLSWTPITSSYGPRSGTGRGRVYTVKSICTDIAGDVASAIVTVTVPHDQMR